MSEPLAPKGIDLKDSASLFVIAWNDGAETRIPYRALRLACRCAHCVEETTGRALLDPDSVPADVGVTECREVGLYGIQITWTTGHGTGIYTWEVLRRLGEGER